MKTFCRFLLLVSLAPSLELHAAVYLLSGDANNQLHDADGYMLDLSTDGRYVLFQSGPPVSGSTPGMTRGGLYRRDLQTGTLTFVGVPLGGESNNNPTDAVEASISDDGRYLSWSTPQGMIYWRDQQAGETRLVTANADNVSKRPIISADGRYVAFASAARNLISDTSLLPAANRAAVYLYDSTSTQISIASLTYDGHALTTGVGYTAPALEFDFSANGKYIVFSTESKGMHPDRPDTATLFWVYRRDVQTGDVEIVARTSVGDAVNASFTTPRINYAGDRVAFLGSYVGVFGGDLVSGYSGGFAADVYLKDLSSGDVWRISKTLDDSSPDGAFDGAQTAINARGDVVVFGSSGTEFVAEDTDAGQTGDSMDLFRVDVPASGPVQVSLLTKGADGTTNIGYNHGSWISANGEFVAFVTRYLLSTLGEGSDTSTYSQAIAIGTMPFGGGPSYADWAAGLSPSDQDLLTDPQMDGLNNLEQFIYGMSATTVDDTKRPQSSSATGDLLGLSGDNHVFFTIRLNLRTDLPAGFGWGVDSASSLDELNTNPVAAVQVGDPVANGDSEIRVFRTPFSVDSGNGYIAIKLHGQ